MATKTRNKTNGTWAIQFYRNDGKRPSIRLGKVSEKEAERFRFRVEELERAHAMGHPTPPSTHEWLKTISRKLHDRISATGLIEAEKSTTLANLAEQFIDSTTVKEPTKRKYRSSANHLAEYFGADRDPRTITPAEATNWRKWMLEDRPRKLSSATAAKSVKHAKQFMGYAIDQRMLDEDPFAKLSGYCKPNKERFYFITLEEINKVLEACPDAEWQLLIALARFGGLRTPSEPLLLKWDDINWNENKFLVHSPKTAHHEDGGERWVPIYPELRTHLLAAYEQAEPGNVYCITRYRNSEQNLRTQLQRIIKRAGLSPWPKLWQNMRSTRQTELLDMGHPLQAVTAWIGNSGKVAMDHYLQVREEHFQVAAQKAVQNPVQTVTAKDCQAETGDAEEKTQALAGTAFDADEQGLAFVGNTGQVLPNGPGGTRTLTPVKEMDFESIASANSATGPWGLERDRVSRRGNSV